MNDRTLRVLEYDKIVERVMNEAATSLGRDYTSQMEPLIDMTAIIHLQNETDEAVHILRQNQTPPFSHITNISAHMSRCDIGSTLNIEECIDVAQLLYCGRHLKDFIENFDDDVELLLLTEYVQKISPLKHLEEMIFNNIDENGAIVDDASAKLKSIRTRIRTYERRIRERLQQLIRSKSKMLSDNIVTFRNHRYVLPVKQEYRGAIGGIVHDQSSSGQTLFMEPNAVIQLNNEIQQLVAEERREIEAILQMMTEQIAQFSADILQNQDQIAFVDNIFARAHLAQKMKAAKPSLNDKGLIKMQQARHPLIAEKDVVANDILLGENYHALVITGPNTGGKTVTLKLIGLSVLMAQSGLHIPALDGCQLAVYKKIYADIGDEQSIEQNLSTFSSHMTNIVSIMKDIDQTSLVLFDEIGAGTDPQEGAALAMAILDDVIERKATVVATTHYPELKAYSYNQDSVMNASVEFDVETLKPTYRLLIGIPGRSNAFEISHRLGLSQSIIDQAKGYIGIDSESVENMISALEKTRKEAERDVEISERLMTDSERIHDELKKAWKDFEDKRAQLFKQAEEKAEKAIQKAKEEAEAIVAAMRERKEQTSWKEHEWIEARKSLEEAQVELVKEREVENKVPDELSVGDEIKHKRLQQPGEIVEEKNDDEVVIQVGNMKMTVNKKDLIFVSKGKQKEESTHSVSRVVTTGQALKTELDLRGERYDEAIYKLEKYIDNALVHNYSRVSIIHGKGTGALRKGVEDYLKYHRSVSSYRLGNQNEGGSGVTIIELN